MLEKLQAHCRACEQCRATAEAIPGKLLWCPDGEEIQREIAALLYGHHMDVMRKMRGTYRGLDPFAKMLREMDARQDIRFGS